MKKLGSKMSSLLLAISMTVCMFPILTIDVHAKENVLPAEQFATVEQLKQFNTVSNDDVPAAKVYFGMNPETSTVQQWWIVGNQKDNLTLFTADPLAKNQYFNLDQKDKEYEGRTVYANHYGASNARKTLGIIEKDKNYFSTVEQGLMNATTIYTNDDKYRNEGHSLQESAYSTTDKLYLAYGAYRADKYITVGANTPDSLNGGLHIDNQYWGHSRFWLRTPFEGINIISLLVSSPNDKAGIMVNSEAELMPAFELSLSSVLFASAASVASSDGPLDIKTVNEKAVEGAFTLRYDAGKHKKELGSALVSDDRSEVTLKDVAANTYLVAQNSNGAYAKSVNGNETVLAKDMGLDSFANCKVWLEATDTANRITYATLADEAVLELEVPPEITFDSQHLGYSDISTQTINIKNTGNVNITDIKATLTGTNAEAFTLDTKGMQTSLVPNGTTIIKVKPNINLDAGTYSAQVAVTGEGGMKKTISIRFAVEHHNYKDEWLNDEDMHWHECDCGAKSDETNHIFKWVIDKEATYTEKGLKHEECSVCGYKKASTETPVVTPTNPEKPNTDKPYADKSNADKPNTEKLKIEKPDAAQSNNDKGSAETSDRTNVGLFTSLTIISALSIVVLAVLKKKRTLENK